MLEGIKSISSKNIFPFSFSTESCINLRQSPPQLNISGTCYVSFSYDAEETRDFGENWKTESTDDVKSIWRYHSHAELNTIPLVGRLAIYPGGGYIIELPRNPLDAQDLMENVRKTKWIDEKTRVVFLEFTLFNPNVQLFTVLILLFEYSTTGFVFPYHLAYTANFYHYQNEFETFVALCEILFVVYIFIFTYIEFKRFLKLKCTKYFQDVWSFVELTILTLAYSIFGLFVNRFIICNSLMSGFAESDDFELFISFHAAAFFDAILTYVMSFLVMLTIIKFFKLLRFNARLSMLAHTLYSAKGKLLSYSLAFFGLTMAFGLFAHIVFGSVLEGYKNVPSTITTMFLFLLGQSDYFGLYETNPICGPIFFFLFSFTFQFLFMHYFVTLLMDAFHTTQVYIASVKTEVHMVRYILKSFQEKFTFDQTEKKQRRIY